MRRFPKVRAWWSGVDPRIWIAAERPLMRLRDALVEQGMPRHHAQEFVERLVVSRLRTFGDDYTGYMSHHVREIHRIRAEIEGHYQAVLDAFQSGRPLPSELPSQLHGRLEPLFRQIDEHMQAIEQRNGTRHIDDVDMFELTAHDQDAIDLLNEIERRRAAEPETIEAPDVLIDDPELAVYEQLFAHLPEHQRKFAAREALRRSQRISQWEQQRVERLAAQERRMVAPEDPALRGWLEVQANLFAKEFLPPGWSATIRRLPEFGEANLAQLERLRDFDPTFLSNGYELRIRGPGVDVNPDGARFLAPSGRRYQFLEHKEPLGPRPRSYYDSPEGRQNLRRMLERHAEIARELHSKGCEGFMYTTGQPWLDTLIAEMIGEIRSSNPSLGQFLLLSPGR